ncbi:hypothetical protein MMC25_007661 [Agyrium rufum]|nr:hypothetical protein [Agyrium rufum]
MLNSSCTFASLQSNTTIASDCTVICKPAGWTDLLIFYLGNFFAHAVTVRSEPGQSTYDRIVIAVTALLFPTSGLLAGVEAITSGAKFGKTSLQAGARAGAVYMVTRTWTELKGNDGRSKRPTTSNPLRGDGIKRNDPDGISLVRSENDEQIRAQNQHHKEPHHEEPHHEEPQQEKHQLPISPETQTSEIQVYDKLESENQGSEPQAPERRATEDQMSPRSLGLTFAPFLKRNIPSKSIHGQVSLPFGWTIQPVPPKATFVNDMPEEDHVKFSQEIFGRAHANKPKTTTTTLA